MVQPTDIRIACKLLHEHRVRLSLLSLADVYHNKYCYYLLLTTSTATTNTITISTTVAIGTNICTTKYYYRLASLTPPTKLDF